MWQRRTEQCARHWARRDSWQLELNGKHRDTATSCSNLLCFLVRCAARAVPMPFAVWDMVSAAPPFAGLHHGEVIHRMVTEDLRPGEKLDKRGVCWHHTAGLNITPEDHFDDDTAAPFCQLRVRMCIRVTLSTSCVVDNRSLA